VSSIFELHARVRHLRDALSHLKSNAALEAERLHEALPNGIDAETCGEWAGLVSELREFTMLAESLAPPRTFPPEEARRPAGMEAVAADLFEPIPTYH